MIKRDIFSEQIFQLSEWNKKNIDADIEQVRKNIYCMLAAAKYCNEETKAKAVARKAVANAQEHGAASFSEERLKDIEKFIKKEGTENE